MGFSYGCDKGRNRTPFCMGAGTLAKMYYMSLIARPLLSILSICRCCVPIWRSLPMGACLCAWIGGQTRRERQGGRTLTTGNSVDTQHIGRMQQTARDLAIDAGHMPLDRWSNIGTLRATLCGKCSRCLFVTTVWPLEVGGSALEWPCGVSERAA